MAAAAADTSAVAAGNSPVVALVADSLAEGMLAVGIGGRAGCSSLGSTSCAVRLKKDGTLAAGCATWLGGLACLLLVL